MSRKGRHQDIVEEKNWQLDRSVKQTRQRVERHDVKAPIEKGRVVFACVHVAGNLELCGPKVVGIDFDGWKFLGDIAEHGARGLKSDEISCLLLYWKCQFY